MKTFYKNSFKLFLCFFLICVLFTQNAVAQIVTPGNALNFNGNYNYVGINNTITASFTIEAWVRTTVSSLTGTYAFDGTPIAWADVSGIANDFTFSILNNKLSFYDGNNNVEVNGTKILTDGVWHHIAVVRNAGGTNYLYVDGALDGSGVAGNGLLTGNSAIKFGGNTIDDHYLNGSLDEIRIWSSSRSQAQLVASMYNVINASSVNLIAYYNFDNGIANANNAGVTTLVDLTSNANNGTLNNFTLNGNTSNWVESYAMVVPTATAATSVTTTGFTTNWTAPAIGNVTNYLLDVSTDSSFSSYVSGYNGLSVAGTLQVVTGLSSGTTYYYRVRADKASVTGQGGNSNTITQAIVCTPTPFTNTQSACDSFYWADKNKWYYANNNTDTIMLVNAGGCDSIVTLNLTINNSTTSSTTITSCDSLWWNGTKYTSSGAYTWKGTNAANCDSTATLNLTINNSSSSIFTTSACGSYTWALNNKVYTASNNTDTVHLITVNGCDSLITLNLTILANITGVKVYNVGAYCGTTANTTLTTNINSTFGSVSYEWTAAPFTGTGWQYAGSDSTLVVAVSEPTQYVLKVTIAGCGTFYSNQEMVMPVKAPTVTLAPSPITSICNNSNISFIAASADSGINKYAFYQGSTQVQTGAGLTYTTPNLTTANDGVVYKIEATNTKPVFDGNINENFWGVPLAASVWGPSSSFGAGHELNAVYARADNDNIYLAIGGNVQNQNRIMLFVDSKAGGYNTGNYGRGGLGNNSIKNFNSGNVFDPGFTPDYCVGIGTDATRSQFYFDIVEMKGNAATGTSINNYIGSNLNPTSGYSIGANPANSSQTQGFEMSIPKSALGYTGGDIRIFAMYSADNGFLSNQFLTRATISSGNYGNGVVNFGFAAPDPIVVPVESLTDLTCKTTVTSTVTVKPNLASTTTISACDSLWWNNVEYTATGNYTFTSTGSNGCDSIATLILTINHPTTSTTTTSTCDSLVWNANTYKVDGTYTFSTTNAKGCDSTATLVLTVNHPTTSITTTSSCDSMIWGNTTYYTSGTYTYTTTNASGCDSVATLNLTINNAPAKPVIINPETLVTLTGIGPVTSVVYNCTPVANAVSYQWAYIGTEATISNNGDTTVTVDFFNSFISCAVIQVLAVSNNGCNSQKDTVTVCTGVQPVVLSNFTVEKVNKTALIKWTTATEINSKNFEVQRSIDGKNFVSIGTIVAKGFASEYQFVDDRLSSTVNVIYYRLKQVDNDGKFALSSVRTLNFKPETLNIAIYPNPVTNVLNIKVANGEAKQVRIFNSLGKAVYTKQIINDQLSIINVEQLSAGTYLVEIVTSDGRREVEKFVKK